MSVEPDRRLVIGIAKYQAIAIVLAFILGAAYAGRTGALSAGLAALVSGLASSYLGWQAHKHSGARAAKRVMANFYRGLTGKFVIMCVGLGLVFAYLRPLSGGCVLVGFIAIQAVSWLYPLWWNRYSSNRN